MIRTLFLSIIVTVFSSCSSKNIDLETRIEKAFYYADKNNLKDEIISTKNFEIFSLLNKNESCKKLNVYIEGDGLAFLNKTTISPNPTPVNSILLKNLNLDNSSCKVYLARPCQYYMASSCNSSFWTNKRFSKEVIESYLEVFDYLKKRYKNDSFNIIAHSGGASVAIILSSFRVDIDNLITLAGNFDIEKWVELKNLNPLEGSLNPKDFAYKLENLKQYHFIANKDEVLPKEVFFSYLNSFKSRKNIQYKIIDANHNCCYENSFKIINKL